MTRSHIGAIVFVVSAALAITGCSSPSTGFLGDTSKFASDAKFSGAMVYRHPAKTPKDYSKVWLDTTEVQFAVPGDAVAADPKGMQEFVSFWRGEVEKHMVTSRNFTMATGPGPGTLRFRMALTGVRPAKPGQLFTTTVMPGRLDIGSATLEAEALDSQTNERIFAIIDRSATNRPVGANQLEYAKSTIKEWTDRLFAAH